MLNPKRSFTPKHNERTKDGYTRERDASSMIINIKGNNLREKPKIEAMINQTNTLMIIDFGADYNFIEASIIKKYNMIPEEAPPLTLTFGGG